MENNKFDTWINNSENYELGIFLILFGIVFSISHYYFHQSWNKEGYKLFKPFRRKDKSQTEDNYLIIMHSRTLFGIYVGIIIMIFGIYTIFK